jgi:hypothetical protein
MRRSITLLAAVAALLGCATAAHAASSTWFAGVGGGKKIRPATLYLSGDGTLDVIHARWSSWGGRVATAHGIAAWHGCTPNCAAGKPHRTAVIVTLLHPVSCHGTRYYNTVRLFSRRTGHPMFARALRLEKWAPCRLPRG